MDKRYNMSFPNKYTFVTVGKPLWYKRKKTLRNVLLEENHHLRASNSDTPLVTGRSPVCHMSSVVWLITVFTTGTFLGTSLLSMFFHQRNQGSDCRGTRVATVVPGLKCQDPYSSTEHQTPPPHF